LKSTIGFIKTPNRYIDGIFFKVKVLRFAKVKLKFMLIVSSLERAREAQAIYNPRYVISILSEDEPRPTFDNIVPENHLKLYVECESGGKAYNLTAKQRTENIIKSYENWRLDDANVLIHCAKGVSRSMAAAYILLCMIKPDESEYELAAMLRREAPHADPCLFMINHADEILDRDCRLFDAIDELPPCRTTIDAPIVVLSSAA